MLPLRLDLDAVHGLAAVAVVLVAVVVGVTVPCSLLCVPPSDVECVAFRGDIGVASLQKHNLHDIEQQLGE